VLEDNLRDEQLPHIEDPFLRYRFNIALRMLTRTRHFAEIGRELEAMELDDMAPILGQRPKNRHEGMVAMEQFVRSAGPDLDAELTRYFYRHAMREQALMIGAMGRVENAVVSPIS
jgi:hypothetical protein